MNEFKIPYNHFILQIMIYTFKIMYKVYLNQSLYILNNTIVRYNYNKKQTCFISMIKHSFLYCLFVYVFL